MVSSTQPCTSSSMSYQYWGFEPWISIIRVHGLIHSSMTAPQICRTNIGDLNHGSLEYESMVSSTHPWQLLKYAHTNIGDLNHGSLIIRVHGLIHSTMTYSSSMSYQYWGFEPWISIIRVHGLIHWAMTSPQVCHTNIGDLNRGSL